MNYSPAQMALLGYMEGASEERWCAGWLSDLHLALLGDPAYEWLVGQSGGYWQYGGAGSPNVNGRLLDFVDSTLEELKILHEEKYK